MTDLKTGADAWIYKKDEYKRPGRSKLRTRIDRFKDRRKHKKQRAEQGWSVYDWWNADTYLVAVIASMARKFASPEAHGHPAELTWEQWQGILIHGIAEPLEAYLKAQDGEFSYEEEKHVYARATAAMHVFAEWHSHFWD
jgi:hypothetical protein